MKTPHTITLIRNSKHRQFDPITGTYTEEQGQIEDVPCFANYVSQQRVFELYGDRVSRVLIARFMQPQEPFSKAEYDGRLFVPIEQIDAKKDAYRLKEVSE